VSDGTAVILCFYMYGYIGGCLDTSMRARYFFFCL
jgi:hypothetical protein